ncbi:MAG TPA: hypothetical protein VGF55_14870 [Gemmataceae bacterium]
MTTTRRLDRLERQVAARREAAEPPVNQYAAGALTRSADEARELARLIAGAFAETVGFYRDYYKLSAEGAIDRAEEDSVAAVEHALRGPPDQVNWINLDQVARHDPDAALRRWKEIKAAARGELRTGHRSAETVNGLPRMLWADARYFAVRAELVETLQPRDAAELLLVDQMAAYQTQLWGWQARLTGYASVAELGCREAIRKGQSGEPPRAMYVEAMEQSARMVDLFQKLFHRSLTAFRAQRRQAQVVIRRASQVNVAHNQQINVGGPNSSAGGRPG